MNHNNILDNPKIGDLIKFTEKWSSIFDDHLVFSYGIIYKIETLKQVQERYVFDDEWYRTTLCYPLTVDPYLSEMSLIFYIHWFTDQKFIIETYKLINEEWFRERLFEVISK